MNQTLSTPPVVCRPAQDRDLEEIKDFCRTIWDGHDYIADVVDDWFQDPRGVFAVADYDSRAIACSKITWLADGQWWLEGFRVDPEFQGRRVGSLMHHYVDQWWLEHGDGMLRLMTSSKNKSVHHLCDSTGFTRLFEVRGYRAEPLQGSVDAFASAASSAKDLAPVVEFARHSPSLAITKHMADFGWRFADPTQDRALTCLYPPSSSITEYAFWWRNGKGLLTVWEDFDPDSQEQTMGIGVLACQLEDMSALLTDVRRLASRQERTSVFWLAPIHLQVEHALKQAGYASEWENTACIFEKRHPMTGQRDPSPADSHNLLSNTG